MHVQRASHEPSECRERARGRGGMAPLRCEAGQALVFGALTLFMLAAFVLFVADLGMVTSTRIQVQNAADECALAGALYESNVISAVAYCNEAMAHLYYDALSYAVDTTRTGVLASLKRYGPPSPADRLVYEDADADAPGFTGDPNLVYGRAFDRARDWVPRIERTLNTLARWEWGMALACTDLVKMEIHRTARKHGIEAVAVYPDFDFYPGSGLEFDLHIRRFMQNGQGVGWRVWNQEGYTVEARNIGPYHWVIIDPSRQVVDIERLTGSSYPSYRIRTGSEDVTIERFSDKRVRVERIRRTRDGTVKTTIDTRYIEGFGWAATITTPDYSIDYRPFEHGGYWLDVVNHKTGASDSIALRIGPNGHLQHWVGGWVDIPGQRDQVNVGGTDVPVGIDVRTIHFGDGDYFRFPNQFQLGGISYEIPIKTVDFPSGRATLLDDRIRVDAWLPMPTPAGARRLHFVLDELWNELIIYGVLRNYHVPKDADCRWHSTRDGRQRDRLCRDCQLLEGECDTPGDQETEWTYQYRKDKPYFGREDLRRFAHHAICDRDSYARTHGFAHPVWTTWYNTATGEPHGHDYYQTRPVAAWGVRPNHDSDGDGTDDSVRIYASDTGALDRVDGRRVDPHLRMAKPWDLAGAATRFTPPLRLNEELFYYALTVGCWRSADTAGHPNFLLRNPSWGYVGIASARAGFLELHSDDPRDPTPQYRFTWPTREEVELFVASGYENLYEPVWTAHLWPMTDAIRDEHIRAYAENQTGLSYLLDGLLRTYWVEPQAPEDIGKTPKERPEVPGLLSRMGLNVANPEIGEVVEH